MPQRFHKQTKKALNLPSGPWNPERKELIEDCNPVSLSAQGLPGKEGLESQSNRLIQMLMTDLQANTLIVRVFIEWFSEDVLGLSGIVCGEQTWNTCIYKAWLPGK